MKTKKYDTSLIDAQIKQMKRQTFFEFATQFCWSLFPIGCALFILTFLTMLAYAVVMMATEPSLISKY
jgi:hypothetical protein